MAKAATYKSPSIHPLQAIAKIKMSAMPSVAKATFPKVNRTQVPQAKTAASALSRMANAKTYSIK